MANKRMLHKKISVSLQVNSLPLPARLLFTWLIAHADDEGRLNGEPKYIKAIVLPITNWSLSNIKKYMILMNDEGLIHYWEKNGSWFIEFIKWKQHQHIRQDRFTPSQLPSFNTAADNQMTTNSQPSGDSIAAQDSSVKVSTDQINKGEYSEDKTIADDSYKRITSIANPKDFSPSNAAETAALEVWKEFEPYNPMAFTTTYLHACRKGLSADDIYRFASEIRQDDSIRNPGAVFNRKIKDLLDTRNSL